MATCFSSAHALDRAGAIEIAKRQVQSQCDVATLCTFDARLESNKWYVRVGFTKADAAEDKPAPEDRRPAIFVIDQSGKIVGRIEGK